MGALLASSCGGDDSDATSPPDTDSAESGGVASDTISPDEDGDATPDAEVTTTVAEVTTTVAEVTTTDEADDSGQEAGGDGAAAVECEAGQTLSVTYFPGAFVSFPLFVAEAEGFFTDRDLEVEQVQVSASADATAALLVGSVDLTLNANDLNLTTIDQDLGEVVAVAGSTDEMIYSLVAATDYPTPLADGGAEFPELMEDLRGARVGVGQRGASTEIIMRALLTDAGMDADQDVTFIATGLAQTSLAALDAGTIDVWLGFEPALTLGVEEAQVAKRLFDLSDAPAFNPWIFNSFVGLRDRVEERAGAIACFQDAIRQAHDFIADEANDERLLEIIQVNLGIEAKSTAASLLESGRSSFGFELSSEAIQNMSDYLIRIEQIEGPVTAEEFIYTGAGL